MNRLHTLLLGISLGLLLATAWNLVGSGPKDRRSPPIQDLLHHHQHALELDSPTLEQSWALADAAKAELDGYHASIRTERRALEQMLEQDDVDLQAMSDQLARIGELETRLRTREIETMLKIRALLTPEQVQALRGMQTAPPPEPR